MKLYFILVLCFIINGIVKGINITSKNVVYKKVSTMGVDISYGLYDIEFNGELVKHYGFGCPFYGSLGEIKYNSSQVGQCICDYTISNQPSYPSSCISVHKCSSYDISDKVSNEWNTVLIDGSKNQFSISKETQFRFINKKVAQGFSVSIKPIDGSFTLVYNSYYVTQRFESLNDEIVFSECPVLIPSDRVAFGNYFLDIVPITLNATFTIQLTYLDLPVKVNGVTYTTACSNDMDTHECIGLGSLIDASQSTFYQIDIAQPGYYLVDLKSRGDVVIYISDDPSIIKPNDENAKWVLQVYGNSNYYNSLNIYLNSSTTLYFNLVCPNTICQDALGFSPEFYIVQTQSVVESKISSMGLLEGSLALASTSRIQFNKRHYSCSDFSLCNPFSILFPSKEINPLWPVPPAFQLSIQDFDYRYIENHYSGSIQFKPNSYQFSLILSIDYGNGIIEYLNKNDISNVQIEFINTIFDSSGNVVDLKISNFNQINISNECDGIKFENLVNDLSNGMDDKDLSIVKLNNWKYNFGLVQSKNEWIQCENYVLSYLKLETVKFNVSTPQCIYQQSDSRYHQDPCCNYHLLFSRACTNKLVEFETYQVEEYDSDKIEQECFSKDCTSIILANYANQKFQLRENDGCKVSKYDIINTHLHSYGALRQCRESVLLNIPSCTLDSDCQDFSNGTRKCDLFTRKCIVNYEITDKNYIECVLRSLPSGIRYSLTSTLDINSTVINSIYDRFTINDMVIESGDPKHSTYMYYLDTNNEYSISRGIIDYSNEIQYKSVNQLKGWVLEKEDYFRDPNNKDHVFSYEELKCMAYSKMIPSGYNQDVYSNYYYSCIRDITPPTVHSFCGYCSTDDTFCYIYNESLSQTGKSVYEDTYPFSVSDVKIDESKCNQQLSMCLLKDGSYIPNIEKNECELNQGSCSVPCGYECTGIASKCIWVSIDYEDIGIGSISLNMDQLCIDEGYTFDNDIGVCYTGHANEQDCLYDGFIWLDCPSQELDNCIGPNFNITDADGIDSNNYYRDLCKLKEIQCTSKEDCLKQGQCSDYSIFYNNQMFDDIMPYPNGLGKCLRNHSIDSIYGKTCDPSLEYDSISGCYPMTSIPGREVCEIQGGKWWKPSTNQIECESQMGCKSLDFMYHNNQENINPYNFPFATRFNEMNQDECLLQQDQSGTKWVNKFKWTNAIWYPGVYVTPQWYQNKTFSSMYQEKKVLDYQSLYYGIIDATQDQVSIQYSSEAYCQKEKNENYIKTILCSCGSDNGGNSTCFNSSNRILGQTIVCNKESKQILFSNGNVSFSDTAASYGCEMVEILYITKSVYSISSPQPLSNNFISYLKPPHYSVLNSKKAIVGTLLDDGIIIRSEYGLDNVRVCMTFNGSSSTSDSDFPILDFAIKLENDKLEPYGSVAVREEYDGIVYYCSTIYNLTSYEVLYPMNRVKDWEDQGRRVLDNRSTVLVYILATLFLVTGLYGLLQTIEIVVNKFQNKTPFQLTHLLIVSVTAFILIRSFYFYVLPRGKLSDYPASDYVLVVFPTFIYLSSFSILVILWTVIVFMVLKYNPSAGNMKKKLYAIVSATNTIIYMFFIAIVVIFQYSPYEPNTDCVSLIVNELKNSKTQEAVSIAYSVVQAFISLFIGIAFIYLGRRIVLEMKRVNLGGVYSNNQPKIKALAIICGTGFILHTIFIILISIRSVKYIIFTFVGLIVSEIIPALSILYAFDSRFIKKSSRPHSSSTSTKGVTNINTATTETGTESSELQVKKSLYTETNTESSEYQINNKSK